MSETNDLRVEGVTVGFGAVTALDQVDCRFPGGAISGLLGPNGAGKTTLLNVISGFQRPTYGTVILGGADLVKSGIRGRVLTGLVRTFQTVRLLENESIFNNVALGCERLGAHRPWSQVLGLPGGGVARRRDSDRSERALELVGLANLGHRTPSELPYAKRRLVEIARAIVGEPKVLLLDEPMAGMDKEARVALLETLQQVHVNLGMTMVVVEHDIEVVRRLCSHAVVLASGRFVASDTPDEVISSPKVREAYFGAGHAKS
jgi:branched-chain amino acid transport system ATP-binding protein